MHVWMCHAAVQVTASLAGCSASEGTGLIPTGHTQASTSTFMPLKLEQLEELRTEAFADDVEIDLELMSLWTEDEARSFFERGGPVGDLVPMHVLTERMTLRASCFPWAREVVQPGQVEVHIVKLAMTANSCTYSVCGGAPLFTLSNFPVPDGTLEDGARSYARVPCWGTGVVTASQCASVPVGQRIYGYLPMSPTCLLQPTQVSQTKGTFVDGAPARSQIIKNYRQYSTRPVHASGTPLTADEEDFHTSSGTVFSTGWSLPFFATKLSPAPTALLVTAASSRTSIAAAHATRFHGELKADVIGLTSSKNLKFVQSLGLYDQVVLYDALETQLVETRKVAVMDVAGNVELLERLYALYGPNIVDYQKIGLAHLGQPELGRPPNLPRMSGLVLPQDYNIWPVLQSLAAQRGVQAHEQLMGSCWADYKAKMLPFYTVQRHHGAAETLRAYDETVTKGGCEPNCIHMCSLWPAGQQEPHEQHQRSP